ncbi:DUF1203 domain-containing protein [Saccharopolyspora rhizosphaerae]|uniref:DUF1203 domain-containing protein n=1 Tax=Saccharopolyspora rhizosphaerae TaxID=2492662 RepID=A0A426JPE4_9PSEU|nr:DUF1203 domain-containing protein [Saccharopolyspora rhizosphaerae]RRO15079.1 DUF1203 domain-containing protein [Saccharopolyspora rhizosphaerae]
MNFRVLEIGRTVVEELREVDDAGRAVESHVETTGGPPLRCCLRRAEPGERVALVSCAPLRRWAVEHGVTPGADDEVGPVFVHAEDCGGPDGPGWPEPLRGSRRVLRAYSAEGRIVGGCLLDGKTGKSERTASDLFLDPAVALVHVRAVEFGCFLFELRRR